MGATSKAMQFFAAFAMACMGGMATQDVFANLPDNATGHSTIVGPTQGKVGEFRIGICSFPNLDMGSGLHAHVAYAFDMWQNGGLPGWQRPFPNLTRLQQYAVRFIMYPTSCSPRLATQAGRMFMDAQVNVILGCVCSSVSKVMARVGTVFDMPQVSWVSSDLSLTSPLKKGEYKYFMRTNFIGSEMNRQARTLTVFAWKRLKMIHLSSAFDAPVDQQIAISLSATLRSQFNQQVWLIPLDKAAYDDPRLPQPEMYEVFSTYYNRTIEWGRCPEGMHYSDVTGTCEDWRTWKAELRSWRSRPGLVYFSMLRETRIPMFWLVAGELNMAPSQQKHLIWLTMHNIYRYDGLLANEKYQDPVTGPIGLGTYDYHVGAFSPEQKTHRKVQSAPKGQPGSIARHWDNYRMASFVDFFNQTITRDSIINDLGDWWASTVDSHRGFRCVWGEEGCIADPMHKTGWPLNFCMMLDALSVIYHGFDILLGQNHTVADISGGLLYETMKGVDLTSFCEDGGWMRWDANGDSLRESRQAQKIEMALVQHFPMDGSCNPASGNCRFFYWVCHIDADGYILFDNNTANPLDNERESTWVKDFHGVPTGEAPDCNALLPGSHWDGADCVLCGAGKEVSRATGEPICEQCPPGRSGTNRCDACFLGHFSADAGSAECSECPVGHKCAGLGTSNPVPCPLGFFASANASDSCGQCSAATYADTVGSSQCTPCGPSGGSSETWTTWHELLVQRTVDEGAAWPAQQYVPVASATNKSACGCKTDHYFKDGHCLPCTKGMLCPGNNIVGTAGGYWANPLAPDSVWECFKNPSRCPAGELDACAPKRDLASLACSMCLPGHLPADDGSCTECRNNDLVVFVACLTVVVCGLIAAYVSSHWRDRGTVPKRPVILMGMTVAQLFAFVQVLGVLHAIAVTWPNPFGIILDVAAVFQFDVRMGKADCWAPLDAMGAFLLKLCGVVAMFPVLALIHVAAVKVVLGGSFKEQRPVFIGCCGLVLQGMMISIVSVILAPLQCQESPNGLQTMLSEPSVICFPPDASAPPGSLLPQSPQPTMAALSISACTLPVMFLCGVLWAVRKAPEKVHAGDRAFLRATLFLFTPERFNHTSRWYVVVPVARAILVALVPVLPGSALQLASLVIIITLSNSVTCLERPWRLGEANLLDAFIHGGLTVIIAFACFFPANKPNEYALAVFSSVVLGLLVLGTVTAMGYAVMKRFVLTFRPFEFFLCYHREAAQCMARLLKLHLSEHKLATRKVFLDSDDLLDLPGLVSNIQEKTDIVVVIMTSQTFMRPWCLGEIATAHRNVGVVKLVPVATADARMPNEDFIADLAQVVPGVMSLAQHGLAVDGMQRALRWLVGLPRLKLQEPITNALMDCLCAQLFGARKALADGETTVEQPTGSTRTSWRAAGIEDVIVASSTSAEAASVGCILEKLLVPYTLALCNRLAPCWPAGAELPDTINKIVLVFTNGCWAHQDFAKSLVMAAKKGCTSIPIVSEKDFRYPNEAFLSTIVETGAPAGLACSGKQLAQIVEDIFKDIAVEVGAGDSLPVIDMRVQLVAKAMANTSARSLTFASDSAEDPDSI